MEGARPILPFLSGIVVATVYGVVTYAAQKYLLGNNWVGTMSVTFLFTLPVAIGVVSVALSPPDRRGSTWYLLGVPWISSLLLVAVSTVFFHEAIICIIMALPLL